ncbi:hypothetical protein CRUP_033495 [Coryphaenoides rupestris]|nr:hypothetical protein CRUP_033495 [Coryphaenoides rupestris]
MFGSDPDLSQSTRSFKSTVKSFLRMANEVLLLAAELCELEEVVCTLPRVMFGNYGQQQEVELLAAVEEFRTRMEETTNSTNHSQRVHASQLRVRLGHPACKEELDALRRREEDRQSQYRSAINRTYEELQEILRAREEGVATALASLTETLVSQVDVVLSFERSEQLAAPGNL